jgi:arginine deiminase
MTWGVSSEVGRLRTVLVHQPGYEHRSIVPWNKDAVLFDDLMDVEDARPEHREFTRLMAGEGARVLYLEDLLKDVCASLGDRGAFFREVLGEDVAGGIDVGGLRPHHLIRGYPDHYSLSAPAVLEPLPNLYFARDPAFAVPGAIVISHPARRTRQREARLVAAILRRHPLFEDALVHDGLLRDERARIEGGDVHVVDERTVLVGIGERTNEAGADGLARFLFARTPVERLLKLFIPARREFMHLDTVLTFIDRRRVLTMPYLWEDPELYAGVAAAACAECARLGESYRGPDPQHLRERSRLVAVSRAGATAHFDDALRGLADLGVIDRDGTVEVAGEREQYRTPEEHVVEALREQWNDAANAFALKPGQVMSYTRNDRTIRALEERGVEVVAFRGGELVRGRGGARCMTMPLQRDPA